MIVRGHSHTVIHEPKIINGVLVTQTGSNLNYAGVTTLTFKEKKLMDRAYQLVSLKDFGMTDQEVTLMVEEVNNRPELKKVIGMAVEDLKSKENVASLMTDAMCYATGADFAFYNKGGVRVNAIPKGDITVEMVYKMEPFSNYIVGHEWTLDQLQEFILNDYNCIANPDDRYINYFISAGKYEIIRDQQGEGKEVRFYGKDGKLLNDRKKQYNVVFSNYVASSNLNVKGGKETGIYITDAIAGYLARQNTVFYDQQRAFVK